MIRLQGQNTSVCLYSLPSQLIRPEVEVSWYKLKVSYLPYLTKSQLYPLKPDRVLYFLDEEYKYVGPTLNFKWVQGSLISLRKETKLHFKQSTHAVLGLYGRVWLTQTSCPFLCCSTRFCHWRFGVW